MRSKEAINCWCEPEFADQLKVLAGGKGKRPGFIRRMIEVGLAQTYGTDWRQKANELVDIDHQLDRRRQELFGIASIESESTSDSDLETSVAA